MKEERGVKGDPSIFHFWLEQLHFPFFRPDQSASLRVSADAEHSCEYLLN